MHVVAEQPEIAKPVANFGKARAFSTRAQYPSELCV